MKTLILGFLAACISTNCLATTCKVVLHKNSCWQDFQVTADISVNSGDAKQTSELVVKKGAAVAELTYACTQNDTISIVSHFTPTIWKGRQGAKYKSAKTWNVPQLPKEAKEWVISLCFPEDFQRVPDPFGDLQDCQCESRSKVKRGISRIKSKS